MTFITSLALALPSTATAQRRSRKAAARTEKGSSRTSAKTSADRRGRDTDKSRRASDDDKGKRGGSRRERLERARREAEQRRREEAERRAEAARRAESARQARLAAIARQRALDQALRDEAVANISQDSTTGEDLEVRRIAVAALGHRAGTVVVMDPRSGRIYTIVNQEWALQRGYKPCSTVKLITGLAGINEGVIEPTQQIAAASYRIDLTDALAYSNNPFFQSVGIRVGFDKVVGYARQLGLGEPTGINYPNEYAGRVPLYKSGYGLGRVFSHGDDIEVTPVQLAVLVSAIANGGQVLTPHLPRTPEETFQFKTEVRRRLNIPVESYRRLLPGMIGAVNYGSGKKAYDPLQTIAGKTGTCIGQNGGWLGLFASYAPVEDPRLAVVVISRGPDARAHFPAHVAGKIYRALNGRFGRRRNVPVVATAPNVLAPQPKLDSRTAAAISSEEAEAEASVDSTLDGTMAPRDAQQQPRRGVRSVLQPVETRPEIRATETTTRPAAPSANRTNGANERPRRVLSTSP
ncbi:MAG: penicillin-binding transpeptidase domain-containing protein [Pyrinomonadaceae bacterium]